MPTLENFLSTRAWKHGVPEAGGRGVAPISSLRQETFDCEEVGQGLIGSPLCS